MRLRRTCGTLISDLVRLAEGLNYVWAVWGRRGAMFVTLWGGRDDFRPSWVNAAKPASTTSVGPQWDLVPHLAGRPDGQRSILASRSSNDSRIDHATSSFSCAAGKTAEGEFNEASPAF
jgi:hypothetical protein